MLPLPSLVLRKLVLAELKFQANDTVTNCLFSERVPGKKRIQVMADSDSDGNDSQTPKKTKLELTVKEKEERYMAAAKISPHFDTMVGFRPKCHQGKTGRFAGKRASLHLSSGNMAIRFGPALRTAVVSQGRH